MSELIKSSKKLITLDGDLDFVSGEESGKDTYYRNDGNATVPSFKTVNDNSSPFFNRE